MIELEEIRKEFDFVLKVVLYGGCDVGKSAFLNRLVYNEFAIKKTQSIGVEIGSKVFSKAGLNVQVDVWDAYGGGDGPTRSGLYLKNALGIS